jgi:hypothetical protein
MLVEFEQISLDKFEKDQSDLFLRCWSAAALDRDRWPVCPVGEDRVLARLEKGLARKAGWRNALGLFDLYVGMACANGHVRLTRTPHGSPEPSTDACHPPLGDDVLVAGAYDFARGQADLLARQLDRRSGHHYDAERLHREVPI